MQLILPMQLLLQSPLIPLIQLILSMQLIQVILSILPAVFLTRRPLAFLNRIASWVPVASFLEKETLLASKK